MGNGGGQRSTMGAGGGHAQAHADDTGNRVHRRHTRGGGVRAGAAPCREALRRYPAHARLGAPGVRGGHDGRGGEDRLRALALSLGAPILSVRPLSDVRPAKESLHTPEMRKQRLRLKRFSMAAATYTFVTLVGLGLSRWSASRLPGGALAAYIGLAVAINAIWFTVFITGANLRFREPSLTAAQIVVSALWGTIPLYYLSADRGLVLLCYLPAFSFGILALSFRAYFAVTAAVLAAYVGVLALQYRELGSRMVWQQELLTFGVFAAVLFWFASFGGYVHRMRRRLRRDHAAC